MLGKIYFPDLELQTGCLKTPAGSLTFGLDSGRCPCGVILCGSLGIEINILNPTKVSTNEAIDLVKHFFVLG